VFSNNLRVFASTICKTWSAGEAEEHFNIDLHQAYKHEENNLPGFSSVFHEKLSWRGKVGWNLRLLLQYVFAHAPPHLMPLWHVRKDLVSTEKWIVS